VPALAEAIWWVIFVQQTLDRKDSRDFIVLYKQLWWRRTLAALAFFAVQAISATRLYPPLTLPLFLIGLVATSLRTPVCCLLVLSAVGIFIGTPAVELALLIGVCLPLWVHGLWDPRVLRAIPMAIIYKMQLTALLFEIAVRLELSPADWLR
jgi:hypothetical protein